MKYPADKRGTRIRTSVLALVLMAVVVLLLTGASCVSESSSSSSLTTSPAGAEQTAGGEAGASSATGATTASPITSGQTMIAADGAAATESTATAGTNGDGSETAAASASSTTSAGVTTTTSESLYVASATTVPGHYIKGTVLGSDGRPVADATVYVVLNALDPLYQESGANLVGTATTDDSGNYQVSMSTVPLGTIVDVSAAKAGYASVLMYGTYAHEIEEVDFADYGATKGDRRLPLGDEMPPLPFEDLLPGESEG